MRLSQSSLTSACARCGTARPPRREKPRSDRRAEPDLHEAGSNFDSRNANRHGRNRVADRPRPASVRSGRYLVPIPGSELQLRSLTLSVYARSGRCKPSPNGSIRAFKMLRERAAMPLCAKTLFASALRPDEARLARASAVPARASAAPARASARGVTISPSLVFREAIGATPRRMAPLGRLLHVHLALETAHAHPAYVVVLLAQPHLMRDAISGNRTQSAAISGHQWCCLHSRTAVLSARRALWERSSAARSSSASSSLLPSG